MVNENRGEQNPIIGYDGGKFRRGAELVRTAAVNFKEITRDMDPTMRSSLIRLFEEVINGTRIAADAIHHPFADRDEVIRRGCEDFGGVPDYRTDSENLNTLSRFFYGPPPTK